MAGRAANERNQERKKAHGVDQGPKERSQNRSNIFVRALRRVGEGMRWVWNRLWLSHHTEAVARFTGWVQRFTLVLAVVAMLQVWITVEGNRAVIAPVSVEVEPIKEGYPIEFRFKLTNAGHATGFISNTALLPVFPGRQIPDHPDYSHGLNGYRAYLLPGQSADIVLAPMNGDGSRATWRATDADSATAGSMQLAVYGYIDTWDTFSSLFGGHRIGFCYQFSGNYPPPMSQFAPCVTGALTYERWLAPWTRPQ